MPNLHHMHVQENYYNQLKSGLKTVELRVNDEKRQSIKVGDTVIFKPQGFAQDALKMEVKNCIYAPSFDELLKQINEDALGSVSKIEQLVALNKFYEPEEVKVYGVLGMYLEAL